MGVVHPRYRQQRRRGQDRAPMPVPGRSDHQLDELAKFVEAPDASLSGGEADPAPLALPKFR